jgi:hypothetical protein
MSWRRCPAARQAARQLLACVLQGEREAARRVAHHIHHRGRLHKAAGGGGGQQPTQQLSQARPRRVVRPARQRARHGGRQLAPRQRLQLRRHLGRAGPYDAAEAAAHRQQRQRAGGQEALVRGLVGPGRRHGRHQASLPVVLADGAYLRQEAAKGS